MTTEYSRDVDWSTEYEKWSNIGQEYMREFYEAHPKLAEKEEGYELDETGQVLYLDELLGHWEPMMNYAYPLQCDPTQFDDGKKRIIKVCRETCLTVMYNQDEDAYYLALCGGGMNLSQSIVRAYQILETWAPIALIQNMSKQPELSVSGNDWLKMARQVKKQVEMTIANLESDLKAWDRAITEYRTKVKAKEAIAQIDSEER